MSGGGGIATGKHPVCIAGTTYHTAKTCLLLLNGLLLVGTLVRDDVVLVRLGRRDSLVRLAFLIAEHDGVVRQIGQPVRCHLG